jgi:glycerate-2-kinase
MDLQGVGAAARSCCSANAISIASESGIWAIAGDGDGIEGTEDAAGAVDA